MYMQTTNGKAGNLEENKEGFVAGFGGRKGEW